MKAVSLFSGIGGIELGLSKHGIETDFFCEIDPLAQSVLRRNFPEARFESDIGNISKLPEASIVTAGFPCQDLSQAGSKRGISGSKSGLVGTLFSLIEAQKKSCRPEWVLVENVPYMLRLDRGQAMNVVTSEFARLGYRWAYRVVDARCFGLPQRRQRVMFLASRMGRPEDVLFGDNFDEPDLDGKPSEAKGTGAYGFYWTEGSRGVGWAREGVPPIKCGSTLGIASPPAVWKPRRDFVGTIDIRDAERLQGFPPGWTDLTDVPLRSKAGDRWRLVGNAVSTKMSEWVAGRLLNHRTAEFDSTPFDKSRAWPAAAYGSGTTARQAAVSCWASEAAQQPISSFLDFDLKPLSLRATEGFLKRTTVCTNVIYSDRFIDSLRTHASRVQ